MRYSIFLFKYFHKHFIPFLCDEKNYNSVTETSLDAGNFSYDIRQYS